MRKRRIGPGADPYLPANVAPVQHPPAPHTVQGPAGYGYGYADFDQGMGESEKSFRDYLEIVLSRIRLVLLVFLCVMAIAIAYTFTRTPLYTSEAVIEPIGYGGPGKENVRHVPVRSLYDRSVGLIANQMEIFGTSRSLAEAFKQRMTYDEFPELRTIKPPLWKQAAAWVAGLNPWADQPTAGSVDAPSAEAFPVRASTKPSRKSGLITVAMTAETPALARKMLEIYLDVYLERNLEARRADSLEAAQWLKKELDAISRKLVQTQASLVSFSIEHGIVDSRDGGIGQVMSIVNKTLENRIRSQETKTKLGLLEKEMQSKESGQYVPSGERSEYIGKMKQDLAMLESEYAQQQVIYSENYPKLGLMRKKIKFLSDRIRALEKQTITSAKELAEKEETAAAQSFKTSADEAARIQVLEAEYLTLKKEVEANQEFQKLLLNEYKQMHIQARTIGNNLRMIDPPTLPAKPSWPKTMLNLLIGSILGLGGGIAAAFVANAFDDTIKHHSELEKELGLRKLGVVPDVAKAAHLHNLDEESTDFEFVAHDKPKSPMSDAIRNVQTSIMLSNMDDPVRSLCVSSSVPGEGKTLISVSLATVLTVAGTRRVVLVDADMRKPRVHKALGLTETGSGLADMLNGLEAPLEDVLHPHRIPGFFYITAGNIPPDPISLMTGDKMQLLMDELHERFDYIVVDCPPILGFSDTPILSTYVDGVVLVVQPGKAVKGQVRDAVSSIHSVEGGRILGVVMNKANVGTGYGYKYGYGGYLRYGSYGRYGGDYYGNYKYYADHGEGKR